MVKVKNFRWKHSIETKLLMGFAVVIIVIMTASFFLYHRAIQLSRQTTYEKMYSQTSYYLQALDKEIGHVRQLQIDFFSDRKLTFIIGSDLHLNDYERRDALLSVRERLFTITGVSSLVQDGILYLPKSGYRITPYRVGRIDQEDKERIRWYLQYADGKIHYDGTAFFLVETGAPKVQSDYVPNHVLIISFSTEQLRENLAAVNSSEGSGAFLCHREEDVMIEHSDDRYVGKEIFNLLETDGKGGYRSTQRIKVDGENYLVFVGGQGVMGLFVQYIKESAIMKPINRFRNLAYLLLFLMILAACGFAVYTRRLLHKPISTLLNAFQRIQSGDWTKRIEHNRKDEFSYLYEGFNEMEDQMGNMIEQVYVQTNLAQKAQMKQLQAQIAPHFLYNSFFSLSRKIKRQDYENAEELARHLGAYFQYLTRDHADYVPLEQEVEHAGSYAAIQGTRFVNRIGISFEQLPDRFRQVTVPRLTLQPLLENAFEYGLENKMSGGLLRVRFEETESEFLIYVEDNGEEASDEKLAEMERMLENGKMEEVTGICNIHRRLQIYFQKRGGLRVRRSSLGGVCMMIFIPKGEA